MLRLLHLSLMALWLGCFSPVSAQVAPAPEVERRLTALQVEQKAAQTETRHQIQQVETRLSKVEKKVSDAAIGLFVSGIFCALWAQYTRRSAWLWFFFGLILAPLALICLVWKNADDLREGRMRFWTQDQDSDG